MKAKVVNEIAEAKRLINDFCLREYKSPADFSDISNIGIAYTEYGDDDENTIQVSVNLLDFTLNRKVNDVLIESRKYESLWDMIECELCYLDFGVLTEVADADFCKPEELSHDEAKVVNGTVQVGDVVISIPLDEYMCLVGRVREITRAGSEKQKMQTGNDTDDIWVDFKEFGYSPNRIAEIEKDFQKLYEGPKIEFEDLPLDMVAMDGECLMKISEEETQKPVFDEMRNSVLDAAAWCFKTLYEMKAEAV